MPKSFTDKSVKELERRGWLLVDRAECGGRFAKDLFGFVDAVAFHPERGFLWVQTTSRNNMSTRKKKIFEYHLEKAYLLMSVRYNRIVIHGWDKPKNRWRLKEVDITQEILDQHHELDKI